MHTDLTSRQRRVVLTLFSPRLGMRRSSGVWPALMARLAAASPAPSVTTAAAEPVWVAGWYGKSGQEAIVARASDLRVHRRRIAMQCNLPRDRDRGWQGAGVAGCG